MSQNGQTHFKNLAANAARFSSASDRFGTLCIKWKDRTLILLIFEILYSQRLFEGMKGILHKTM